MKIVKCLGCHDVIMPIISMRQCLCGKTQCRLKLKFYTVVSGPAVVITITDDSFYEAIEDERSQSLRRKSKRRKIQAFLEPSSCDTVLFVDGVE